jgi:hypothetical protein
MDNIKVRINVKADNLIKQSGNVEFQHRKMCEFLASKNMLDEFCEYLVREEIKIELLEFIREDNITVKTLESDGEVIQTTYEENGNGN